MPIDFRCTQCGKLLRTPDDTAGKQAKCPACGAIAVVPQSLAAAPTPAAGYAAPTDSAAAANPYQAPGLGMPGQPVAVGQPTIVDFGDLLNRAWMIFKERMGDCILAFILVTAVNFGASAVIGAILKIVFTVLNHGRPLGEGLAAVHRGMTTLLGTPINVWMQLGAVIFMLKIARGEAAIFGDLFAGGPYLLRGLGGWFLVFIACFFGLLACVIPGIIAGLMFSQYTYMIVDRQAGVVDSLMMSKEVTTGNKLTLFLLAVVTCIIAVFGTILTCCIGFFFILPYIMLLGAVTYLAMTGQPTADQQMDGAATNG